MRALVALLTAVVAAVLAGCRHTAQEPTRATAAGPLAEAAQRTKDAETARLRVEVAITGQGVVSALSGRGEVDYEERRSRVLLSLGEEPGETEPGPAGGGVETVTDGATAYARSALLDQFLLEQGRGAQTGTWVRRELGPSAREEGLDLGAMLYWGAGSPDPTVTLDYLLATGREVEQVGPARVGDVTTTRYRTTVDLREVPQAVPVDDRDTVRRSIASVVDPSATRRVPVEAWVDEEGRVRRLRVEYPIASGGGEAGLEVVLALFDFGADVDIEPPDEQEVFELDELADQGAES